jgi:hypothetical protein
MLGLAAALYAYLATRPVATTRAGDQVWAPLKPGESMVLALPAGGAASPPIFSFRGPVGRSVFVDVAQGALGPSPPPDIAPLFQQASGAPVPIQWRLGDGGDSRAIVAVGLKPTGAGPPRLSFLPSSDPNNVDLQLKAENAELQIMMSGVATGGQNAPAAQLAVGKPDDPAHPPIPLQVPGGGALPIPVTAPPGTLVTIRYAEDAAAGPKGAGFTLGPDPSPLAVASVQIDPPAGPSGASNAIFATRLYACGAPPKDPRQWFALANDWTQIVWFGGLGQVACRPTLGVKLGPDGFTPQISGGPAFVAVDGKAQAVSWEWVKSNPFLIGFLALIPPAVAASTYHIVFAPLGKKRRDKTRGRSARPAGRRGLRVGGS